MTFPDRSPDPEHEGVPGPHPQPPVPDQVPPGVDPHKPAGPPGPPHPHEPPLEHDPHGDGEVRPERDG
ncbi:hypothetical protein AAC691_18860 [Nguyenibacter vanlangensis]|uniref:Uncharacterized protein n=1 Tax=Nguyenibacter vanlangensis TaxID=1216886 RepID=A0ABZ3D3S5_9PROT